MDYVALKNYDLDGCVSAIMLDRHYHFEKLFACGYSKLDNNIKKAINYSRDKGIKGICVADWSLTLEQYKLIESNFDEVVMIDHHGTSQEVYDYLGKSLDVKLCAAAQCAKHIVKLGYRLDTADKKLISATNSYDNWKTEHKDFMLGRQLTEIFFDINFWEFFYRFRDGFYGWTEDESVFLFKAFEEKEQTFQNSVIEDIGDNKIVAVLTSHNIINDMTLLMPEFEHYFIFYRDMDTGDCVLSIRTRSDDHNIGELAQGFHKEHPEEILNSGGHHKAGALRFASDDFDIVLDLMEDFINEF